MEKHIYSTGIIGNCAFLAHVNTNTNIEWMCWPRFDSHFIFGGLLDDKKGGEFSIKPLGEFSSKQYYLENTNVLRTEITCANGKYRVTDFAPRFRKNGRYYKPLILIRKIEVLEGNPRISVKCEPVCDYGRNSWDQLLGSDSIEYTGCGERMTLTSNIPLSYLEDASFFSLNETKYLIVKLWLGA
jgi:GH15 family glucan-1,4-alpha-glucosidase